MYTRESWVFLCRLYLHLMTLVSMERSYKYFWRKIKNDRENIVHDTYLFFMKCISYYTMDPLSIVISLSLNSIHSNSLRYINSTWVLKTRPIEKNTHHSFKANFDGKCKSIPKMSVLKSGARYFKSKGPFSHFSSWEKTFQEDGPSDNEKIVIWK